MSSEARVLDEPLLTASQLGVLLGGIPAKTILQYARDGRIPCLRIGRHVRFVRRDVDLALDAQRSRWVAGAGRVGASGVRASKAPAERSQVQTLSRR